MKRIRHFLKKNSEQIFNVAIIIATMFLVLIWTACERKFYTSLSDRCVVLYNGRYDIIYIQEDSLYLFVPSMDNENTIKVYKTSQKSSELEILTEEIIENDGK